MTSSNKHQSQPNNTINSEYQDLQRIYLDWHSGKRPLSGFINELQHKIAQEANKARIETAKEIFFMLWDEDGSRFQYDDPPKEILDYIAQLTAENRSSDHE